MPQSKATKKFEKNHLKDTIKRRNDFKKIKQKMQLKEKRKARRARDNAPADGEDDESGAEKDDKTKDSKFADMSVDEFFAGGFEIPELDTKSKKDKAQQKNGKRKRVEAEAEEEEGSISEGSDAHSLLEESDNEFADHKQELETLAKKDPEFYQHLKENDPELLDFANDAELANIQLSESEDEAPRSKKQKTSKKKSTMEDEEDLDMERSNEVTSAMVKKWHTALVEKQSLRQMREVILAFRAAVRSNDAERKEFKYSVSDPEVYHELLVVALTDVPTILSHHLPTKELTSGKLRVPTDSKKFSTLAPIVKTYATSIQHLLTTLSDSATVKLTLSSLLSLLPYLLSFKKLLRELCKTTSSIWAAHSHNDATRISAFLILRRLAVLGDPGIRETVLKATYQGLVQSSRSTNIRNISGINLMKNSAVELWGLVDSGQAYTMAFNFIRQLAIHLRNSIISKEKESHKTVYNFQFVHSLDFWSRVLTAQCDSLREAERGKPSGLRPLLYPLVQVCLGAMRLIPTPLYFPLRFQIIRSLLRIAQSTDTYVPLAPALLEVLNSPECKKAPKQATLKPVEWETSIRVSKTYLKTRVWQDGLGEQVVELLGEWAGQWSKSVAFPELVLPINVMLKRWLKTASGGKGQPGTQSGKSKSGNRNSKLNSMVALLVQKFESNARWIEERRAKVDFAPNNRVGVETFLKEEPVEKTPLGAYLVGQRKAKQERAKVLEQGRRADEEKRKAEEADEEKKSKTRPVDGVADDDTEEEDIDLGVEDDLEDEEDDE